ncbi:MAG: hypothetical protein M3179_01215 [Actinomycetota bacterium]|nr:hypothetical protein [Actinomycetota bacterium]
MIFRRSRSNRARRAVAGVGLLGLIGPLLIATAGPAAAATRTFSTVGTFQWEVPNGVTQATFTVRGA